MFSRIAFGVSTTSFVLLALSGCAGVEVKRHDGYIRAAKSARVQVWIPPSMRIEISRYGRIGTNRISQWDHDLAHQEFGELYVHMKEQLNVRFAESLNQAGLRRGDDLTVVVTVEQGFHDNRGPGARIKVSAEFKGEPGGSGLPVWSFEHTEMKPLGGNTEKTAKNLVDKIINEVQASGMLGTVKQR